MTDNMPGDLLILLGFVFNLLAGVAFFLAARGNMSYENLAKKSYHVFTIVTGLAVAYLFYLFFSHNYAIGYVHDYSDNSLGFFYLLSAFWGGQEGTYLLWLFLNALFGYIILKRGAEYRLWAMVIYSSVNLFFLVILLNLSPFAMLDHRPLDGAGLNPLLQDPWMVIHPPVIFVGYAMSAVPYALAMAALIIGDFSKWLARVFPWVVITTLMLAAGNILGGYWAYKTLGWGGYWAWDPVENSSFIPWFVSLALIHGLVIEKRSGALRKTNILVTAFVFLLVIYGTFLTRSGVLADFSVHSFVDLGINQYLAGFMIFYVVLTLVLFLPRIRKLGHTALNYNFYNREFILFAGMALLFIFSVIVLFWTSLPILSGLFSDEPRAADLTTYNGFALPFAILFALLLTVSPFLNFNSFKPPGWKQKLVIAAIASAVVGFGGFYFAADADFVFAVVFSLVLTALVMFTFKSDLMKSIMPSVVVFGLAIVGCVLLNIDNFIYILFVAAAAMAIVSNFTSILGFLPGRWRLMGGQLTHLGFGLMIIGVLGSSAYSVDQKLVLPRGEPGEAYGLAVSYEGMQNDITFPKNRLLLTYEEDGRAYSIEPQLYYSERLNGIMRKPYIQRNLLYDLYFSPEQVQPMEGRESIDVPAEFGAEEKYQVTISQIIADRGAVGLTIPGLDENGQNGLILEKGQTKVIGDYSFTFIDFEMGGHGSDSEMTVVANVNVEHQGDTVQLKPALKMIADTAGPEDRLILDITRKPVINLVWFGTTLILLGTIIVFVRRRSELS